MLSVQTLERRDDILLTHLHRIGDHTRGLFEAEASIAMSAAHALENVEIVFLSNHDSFPHCVIPEKPTFCVVINSVAVCGSPAPFTFTRMRTKIRQASPRHWQ